MKSNLQYQIQMIRKHAMAIRLPGNAGLWLVVCGVALFAGCDMGTYNERLNEAPPVVEDTVDNDENSNPDDADEDPVDDDAQ